MQQLKDLPIEALISFDAHQRNQILDLLILINTDGEPQKIKKLATKVTASILGQVDDHKHPVKQRRSHKHRRYQRSA
jgi:hypothetical protein